MAEREGEALSPYQRIDAELKAEEKRLSKFHDDPWKEPMLNNWLGGIKTARDLFGRDPIQRPTAEVERLRANAPDGVDGHPCIRVEAYESMRAERDAALAAVAGIEEVARRVLSEHFVMWTELDGTDTPPGEWRCQCGAKFGFSDTAIAHQAERIASELRGEG